MRIPAVFAQRYRTRVPRKVRTRNALKTAVSGTVYEAEAKTDG